MIQSLQGHGILCIQVISLSKNEIESRTWFVRVIVIKLFFRELVFSILNGGTAVAVPPPFRHGEPALCGSYSLVAPY